MQEPQTILQTFFKISIQFLLKNKIKSTISLPSPHPLVSLCIFGDLLICKIVYGSSIALIENFI